MQVKQPVTPELRQWIIAQAQAGHAPEVVLQSMRASGWNEDVAIAAMEDTLQGFLAEHQAQAAGRAGGGCCRLPCRCRMPNVAESPVWVDGGDRQVQIVMAMKQPRVIVFGGLLERR